MTKRNNHDFALPGATSRYSPPPSSMRIDFAPLAGSWDTFRIMTAESFGISNPHWPILCAEARLPPFLPPSEGAIGCVGLGSALMKFFERRVAV